MLAGICDVEPPQHFPTNDTVKPGAVFIVIEKIIKEGKKHFGMLSMNKKGNILLNNSIVNDIAECVSGCLRNRSGVD
jgi:hypothetical protein